VRKLIFWSAALSFVFLFSACSINANTDLSETSIVVTDNDVLKLIDVQKNEDGNTIVNTDSWQILNDYDIFRQYFFGVWNENNSDFAEEFIIDDSEMDFLVQNHVFYFNNFYKVNDTTVAFDIRGNADRMLFWIETDNPNNMYYVNLAENWLYSYDLTQTIGLYEKTDLRPNTPENDFCSVYRLREIARDYDINFDMLVDVEYQATPNSDWLFHDAKYQFYPVYLSEKSTGKLVFRTTLGNVAAAAKEIDVSIFIEKTNGEWVRIIRVDDF